MNILNIEDLSPSQEFVVLMLSHSIIPIITQPTRVTPMAATMIYNMFCNSVLDTHFT